jgi:hypothetical protein
MSLVSLFLCALLAPAFVLAQPAHAPIDAGVRPDASRPIAIPLPGPAVTSDAGARSDAAADVPAHADARPVLAAPSVPSATISPAAAAEQTLIACLNSCPRAQVCGDSAGLTVCLHSGTPACQAISATMQISGVVLQSVCRVLPLTSPLAPVAAPVHPDIAAQRAACETNRACQAEATPELRRACIACCLRQDSNWVASTNEAMQSVIRISGRSEASLRCVQRSFRPFYGVISGIASHIVQMDDHLQQTDTRLAALESSSGTGSAVAGLSGVITTLVALQSLQAQQSDLRDQVVSCITSRRVSTLESMMRRTEAWRRYDHGERGERVAVPAVLPSERDPGRVISDQQCNVIAQTAEMTRLNTEIIRLQHQLPVDPTTRAPIEATSLLQVVNNEAAVCATAPTSESCRTARSALVALLRAVPHEGVDLVPTAEAAATPDPSHEEALLPAGD